MTGARSTPRPTAPTSGSMARPWRCAATPPAAAASARRRPSTSASTRPPTSGSTNRADILHDQLEIALRNVTNAPRVDCCDEPGAQSTAASTRPTTTGWSRTPRRSSSRTGSSPGGKPLAFDDGQRSQAEANRLAQWLLDNGVELQRTTKDYVYGGKTIAKHSYVVEMDQFMRGFAYTALSAGQDISDRITTLYAPPGAWSHGQLWGADTIEVPASATFAPKTEPLTTLERVQRRGPGRRQGRLVRPRPARCRGEPRRPRPAPDGIDGEVAEASFTSASAGVDAGGLRPLPEHPGQRHGPHGRRAWRRASGSSGSSTAAKPATSQLDEAPQVAVLVNNAAPAINDTMFSLQPDLRRGRALRVGAQRRRSRCRTRRTTRWPTSTSSTTPARTIPADWRTPRLDERTRSPSSPGAVGYIGTGRVPANNFTFLDRGRSRRRRRSQAKAEARDGAARPVGISPGYAENSRRAGSPRHRGVPRPATDFWYLPSNVTYFNAVPTGAVIDGRLPRRAECRPRPVPPSCSSAGLWRNRTTGNGPATIGAPVIVHGDTVVGSRYVGVATNPFSRGDFERIWPLIATVGPVEQPDRRAVASAPNSGDPMSRHYAGSSGV